MLLSPEGNKRLLVGGKSMFLSTEEKEVFRRVISSVLYYESQGIAVTGEIARELGLSNYKVRKHLRRLASIGLLDKDIRRGGYYESVGIPIPPIMGYKLTDKAKKLSLFKQMDKEERDNFEKSFFYLGN